MMCERASDSLDALLDGEVDAVTARELEAHLADCGRCSEKFASRRALRAAVQTALPREKAPRDLLDAFRREMGAPPRTVLWKRVSFALAACLALAVGGLLWQAVRVAPRRGVQDPGMVAWVVSDHLRALRMAAAEGDAGLIEVRSTDRHTVKPWFAGRLTFSPPVRDLAAAGFPLVGGRVDLVGERPVAALVYTSDKHIIDLFVWPGAEADAPPAHQETGRSEGAGYHVVHWSEGGMDCWAVSDVEADRLLGFARAFRAAGVSP